MSRTRRSSWEALLKPSLLGCYRIPERQRRTPRGPTSQGMIAGPLAGH
jgi:hypothetical protein